MGGQVSKIMGKIFGTKEMRILMLGLDAAGKTSESTGAEEKGQTTEMLTMVSHTSSDPL